MISRSRLPSSGQAERRTSQYALNSHEGKGTYSRPEKRPLCGSRSRRFTGTSGMAKFRHRKSADGTALNGRYSTSGLKPKSPARKTSGRNNDRASHGDQTRCHYGNKSISTSDHTSSRP